MKMKKPAAYSRLALVVLLSVAAFVIVNPRGGQATPPPGGPSVEIINTAANPVPQLDVDNPARQPFYCIAPQQFLGGSNASGSQFEFSDGTACNVPNGKVAVVELITAEATLPPGQQALYLQVSAHLTIPGHNDSGTTFNVVMIPAGSDVNGNGVFVATQPVRIYCEKNENMMAAIFRSSVSGTGGGGVQISGYYVNLP
jgi:hypothetical protein